LRFKSNGRWTPQPSLPGQIYDENDFSVAIWSDFSFAFWPLAVHFSDAVFRPGFVWGGLIWLFWMYRWLFIDSLLGKLRSWPFSFPRLKVWTIHKWKKFLSRNDGGIETFAAKTQTFDSQRPIFDPFGSAALRPDTLNENTFELRRKGKSAETFLILCSLMRCLCASSSFGPSVSACNT
jgi:hypothetical protein